MSKEIIIDGVNVAECDAYKDKHCMDKTSIMFCNLNICSNFPNCYYKQFKRLQAENEQLKALCDTYFSCYRAKHNDIEGNLFSYRKALEEIRGICKKETSHYDRLIEIVTKVGEVLDERN